MNAYAFQRMWRLIAARPGVFLVCFVIATVGLWLALLLSLIARTAWPYAAQVDVAPEISVFVAPGTASADLKALQGRLEASRGVRTLQLITRDAAWAELVQRGQISPQLNDMKGELKTNPLPDVFVLRLAPQLSVAELDALVASIRTMPRVDGVEADLGWFRKARAAARVALGLGAALGGAALLCVLFGLVVAVRLLTMSGRQELRVLQLVGADGSFARRPFVWAGGLSFALAAATALALAWLTLRLLAADIAALAQAYGLALQLQLPPLPWLAAFVFGASVLGLMVSALTARVSAPQ